MGKRKTTTPPADEPIEEAEIEAEHEEPAGVADDDDSDDDSDDEEEDAPTPAAPPAKKVMIGGKSVRLAPPDDYAVCSEVVAFALNNSRRACAAALGFCWRGKDPPKARYTQCGYDVGKYGGEIINEMQKRGISIDEVLDAGLVAYRHMIRKSVAMRITEKEVADTADF